MVIIVCNLHPELMSIIHISVQNIEHVKHSLCHCDLADIRSKPEVVTEAVDDPACVLRNFLLLFTCEMRWVNRHVLVIFVAREDEFIVFDVEVLLIVMQGTEKVHVCIFPFFVISLIIERSARLFPFIEDFKHFLGLLLRGFTD